MFRSPNSTSSGNGFDTATIRAVWSKALLVPGYPSYRTDACGALIRWEEYGTTTDHGWEIDHIRPVAKNGGDELSNLQALHWENNRHKSDNFPSWSCKLTR
ncbi:MAG TPA: HNH endonuclease signature motif containing protein [Bacteroidota bacterium]|nr:HNH endonuclease signature motif containing protein [Bacteroidota bacterium]